MTQMKYPDAKVLENSLLARKYTKKERFRRENFFIKKFLITQKKRKTLRMKVLGEILCFRTVFASLKLRQCFYFRKLNDQIMFEGLSYFTILSLKMLNRS